MTTFGVVQTARQEKLYDNNNVTDDKPTEKRTPDRDSAQKKKLKSVVLVVPEQMRKYGKASPEELMDHIKETNYPAEDSGFK